MSTESTALLAMSPLQTGRAWSQRRYSDHELLAAIIFMTGPLSESSTTRWLDTADAVQIR